MKEHKHAEVLRAIADGKDVQYKTNSNNEWITCDLLAYVAYSEQLFEWRIKPERKPDIVRYLGCSKHGDGIGGICNEYGVINHWFNQLKLTFDAETGKLKSSEVIK